MAADAYFSVMPFVDGMADAGFCIISRLRSNACLKYLYTGSRTGKRGASKKYDVKIDVKNPDTNRTIV